MKTFKDLGPAKRYAFGRGRRTPKRSMIGGLIVAVPHYVVVGPDELNEDAFDDQTWQALLHGHFVQLKKGTTHTQVNDRIELEDYARDAELCELGFGDA